MPLAGGEPVQVKRDPADDFAREQEPVQLTDSPEDEHDLRRFWTIEPGNNVPRQIVRFDDPSRRSTRIEMDVDGERVYFSLGDPQSDLFVAALSLPGASRG